MPLTCKWLARSHSNWQTLHVEELGLTFVGFSRAADQTVFFVPQLRWFLDAGGMAHVEQVPTHVFVTHSHSDHSYGLPSMVSSRHTTEVYVPKEIEAFVEAFLQASQNLNAHAVRGNYPYAQYTLRGVVPGDRFDIAIGKRNVAIEVMRCSHAGCPCVAYGFYDKRQKLKPEFQSDEFKTRIGELRRQGVQVTEEVNIPLFAFLGDTNNDIFAHNPQITSFPLVFCECTVLDSDVDVNETHKRGHMHWSALRDVCARNQQVTWILMHLSRRYTREYAKSVVDQAELQNVLLWVED